MEICHLTNKRHLHAVGKGKGPLSSKRVLHELEPLSVTSSIKKGVSAIHHRLVEIVRLDVLVIKNNPLKHLANQDHFGCITREGAEVGRLQQRAVLIVLLVQVKLVLLCTRAQFVELLGIP